MIKTIKELVIAGMATSFGAWALYLGHNSVVIGGVLAFLGGLVGYGIGKKT